MTSARVGVTRFVAMQLSRIARSARAPKASGVSRPSAASRSVAGMPISSAIARVFSMTASGVLSASSMASATRSSRRRISLSRLLYSST